MRIRPMSVAKPAAIASRTRISGPWATTCRSPPVFSASRGRMAATESSFQEISKRASRAMAQASAAPGVAAMIWVKLTNKVTTLFLGQKEQCSVRGGRISGDERDQRCPKNDRHENHHQESDAARKFVLLANQPSRRGPHYFGHLVALQRFFVVQSMHERGLSSGGVQCACSRVRGTTSRMVSPGSRWPASISQKP